MVITIQFECMDCGMDLEGEILETSGVVRVSPCSCRSLSDAELRCDVCGRALEFTPSTKDQRRYVVVTCDCAVKKLDDIIEELTSVTDDFESVQMSIVKALDNKFECEKQRLIRKN